MKKEVNISFDVPESVTLEQFEEWFKYKIGWGGCSCENPLIDKDLSDLVSMYYI